MSSIKPIIIVWQTLLGHYRLHRAQGLFLLLGLSLGVAILLGTLLLNQAATDAFNRAEATIGGKIIANIIPANGAKTFNEQHYVALRKKGHDNLMPMIEGMVVLENAKQFSLKGLDIIANLHRDAGPFIDSQLEQQQTNPKLQQQTSQVLPMAFSYPPYQLLVAQSQAKLLGLTDGQQLRTRSGQLLPKITIVDDDFGINYELVCDIRCAQSLLNQKDKLSSLVLTQPSNDEQQLIADIKLVSQNTLTLQTNDKNPENKAMGDAFFLNITAVSLLAFLVGCFIAYNAVRFSIDERLKLVQRLRLLGVSNNTLVTALLLELGAWAILASIIGGTLGFMLAQNLIAGVGLTVKQLFGGTNLLTLNALGQWWLQSFTISLTATTLATAGSFYQLSRHKPLENPEQTSNKHWQSVLGFTLLVAGCLLSLAKHTQVLGFIITFCWFLGVALLVPAIIKLSYALLGQLPTLKRYPKLHWAIEDGRQNPQRLSVAMMAFTVAIAASIGVNTMVSSFKLALENHLDLVLAEDIYLSPSDEQSPAIFAFLTDHPDVALAYRFLTTTTDIHASAVINSADSSPQKITVHTISDHPLRQNSINLVNQPNDLWQQFQQRKGVIINQTLALRFNLTTGDNISFGQTTTKILAVYYNYGSPNSAIAISQDWFSTLWPTVKNSEIGVFARQEPANVQPPAKNVIEQLKSQFNLKTHHYIEPQGIKNIALTIFKQTFKVTQLLIVLTLIIAAAGIYCACYAAQLNNQRQLTLLKVLGVSHRQLVGLSLLQLGFNAIIAALIAIPLGLMIAWASVAIVLQYSFGWHFPIVIEQGLLILIAISAIFIAVIAGAAPLYQQSRKTAISAFREAL